MLKLTVAAICFFILTFVAVRVITTPPAPAQVIKAAPPQLQAGDLVVDWPKHVGTMVTVTGVAYAADEDGSHFKMNGATFLLRKVETETHRYLMKKCHDFDGCPVTITAFPIRDKRAFPVLANAKLAAR